MKKKNEKSGNNPEINEENEMNNYGENNNNEIIQKILNAIAQQQQNNLKGGKISTQTMVIGKLIYKCNYFDDKINFISAENSNSVNNDNKYNYLFYNCLSKINKLNEIYKFNKFKINENQENELIYRLINPFVEFLFFIIKDYQLKIDKLYKEIEQLKIKKDNINKDKIHSLYENKYLNKYEIENEKNESNDLEGIISNYFEDIYIENNLYSFKGDIIPNKYMNLDDEFMH